MSKFPMNQDDEDRQAAQANALHGLDGEDGIQCRTCGETGLYWQSCVAPDGRSDWMALFNETSHRRHVCKLALDAFPEASE